MIKKTALITGASRRIGAAFACHLAKNGWNLALHYNTSNNQTSILKKKLELQYHNARFQTFACDLKKGEKVGRLISQVIKYFGIFDLLINNASIFNSSSIRQSSQELFDNHIDINFRAPFLLTRDFANQCKKGVIVNMLDTRISSNESSHAAYTLSKKALAEFTNMAAIELSPKIRINAIAPGAILPPKGKNDKYISEKIKNTPMKNSGGVTSILQSLDYILNNQNLTGQVIFCDGGEHLI